MQRAVLGLWYSPRTLCLPAYDVDARMANFIFSAMTKLNEVTSSGSRQKITELWPHLHDLHTKFREFWTRGF